MILTYKFSISYRNQSLAPPPYFTKGSKTTKVLGTLSSHSLSQHFTQSAVLLSFLFSHQRPVFFSNPLIRCSGLRYGQGSSRRSTARANRLLWSVIMIEYLDPGWYALKTDKMFLAITFGQPICGKRFDIGEAQPAEFRP